MLMWRVIFGPLLAAILVAQTEPAVPAAPEIRVRLGFDEPPAAKATRTVNAVTGGAMLVRQAIATGRSFVLGGHPDQQVSLGVLGIAQPATVAVWIKRAVERHGDASGADKKEYIQEQAKGLGRLLSPLTGNRTLQGALRIGPEKLEVWRGQGGWATIASTAVPVGVWVHIAVTFDSERTATGFLNGRKYSQVPCEFQFETQPAALGAAFLGQYGFPFAGEIDEVRIYRGVVGDSGIAELALASPEKTSKFGKP